MRFWSNAMLLLKAFCSYSAQLKVSPSLSLFPSLSLSPSPSPSLPLSLSVEDTGETSTALC